MSFGEFFLQSNNGNKVNLNFKGKLKREDFAGNQKLLKIFDYFDSDKSGVIENLTKDGKNEIANIFAHIKQASELREGEGNAVLDSREAISLTSFIKGLNGVTASELFEFLKTVEEKKNVVEKETVDVSSDGTKTVVRTLQDGSVETDVFYPNGELKLRVTETPISEDFTNGKKNTDSDTEVLEKEGSDGKKEMLSLAKGAKEGAIVLEGDSAKYLSEKYNKEVVSAYYKNGVMELRDKNNKPVMRVAVDISQKVEKELREFIGKHLKETSENVLELAKTVGWVDKLGIDLQDISINKTNLALSILNPALLLTVLEASGKEKLEEYLNQLRDNVKNGELLESGATTQGAFDSRFERITGHSEVNFLQIERLRQTADKYNNVQGLNQRIVLLNQGIKEVKQLYQNYRAQKQGIPNSGKLNSNFDGKILEILTQFFNGDENVAKALIQTISKGITSKDDLYRKFNAVLTTIKQKASETKADLLKGESEEELKARYENEYKGMYGQDAVFKAEELITNGKETGGMIQIGMMTAAQMLLAAATMGTGNAALMALQSNALIGFLSTVGTDYALSLSNILSSERGFTAEAQEELHQRTLGTAEFIGFGMVAANPLSRAVGKYASKLFASDAEKVLEGAFAQEVKAGTNAVTRTTTGALTKTTLSLDSALEWVVVKGSEFGTEILSFSGFELLQQDEEFNEVVKGQASTLTKLKVMNAALQVMLGSFVRNQALRGQSKLVVKECNKMLKDMGIEGGKLTENKRPGGSNYTLEINGETMTFKDIKELQANFMSVLAENYIKTRQIPEEIKNLDNEALVSEFTQLIQKQDALSESENARLVDLYQELQNRGLGVNDGVNDKVKNNPTPKSKISTLPQREGEGTTSSNTVPSPLTPSPREGNGSMTAQRYTKPLTPYTEAGNKIHNLKSYKPEENPQLIAEIKADIEALRKTDPQKADELQIVLEMFTNPTVVAKVTDTQIDAVVNYLNDHYEHLEGYLTEQVGEIGINDPKYGRFGHRIKGESSTRDKVANFIKDAIKEEQKAKENGEEYTPKTLLSAFKDVRDKYACRTVFELGDFTKHPEVKVLIAQAKTLASEGKPELAAAKMHEAEFKAAELQSEPVRLQLLEAMRKAKEEGKDLKAVRISNYASENGIPIFTPEQMESLKLDAAQMGIDVEFIRLAKEIDPKATTEFVDGASTKKQPSGYTALQINFETKTGEVIEWQYRGELVNEFAEAEHLPYDLRTGKHPWKQIPELKALYEPIADLLQEKVMPKYAYKQLNRYFTDYYTHLRRLELGFESEEPRLSDYENWKAKDENGVEQRYSFKFDSRLEAKNLMELHHFAEGIKDGLITPERALEEFNMFVEKSSQSESSFKASDKAVEQLNEKLINKSNISDLMPLLEIIQKDKHKSFKCDKYGMSFYDNKNKIQYDVVFDGLGNIIKFSKINYKSDYDYKKDKTFYVFGKNGKQTEISQDEYQKTQANIRTDELRNFIITNPELLPKKTRNLLLQDTNHYYTQEDVCELSLMLKTTEDIAIANKLLDTRGNEHRAIRVIGDALNLSQQKFGLRDVIKVLKSEKARAMVLEKIAANKYVKKTELEPLLDGETFSALVKHKLADESDISYRTKDITLDNIEDVVNEYQTNPQTREQINKQIPDGEAACINGKMYCRADNNLIPIQLNKATFDKLFPVEERYNISQGRIGDCYFIAELGGYADTPNGRAALYSSFRQEGNDIIIKFPRFNNIEVKFENGKLNKLSYRSMYKFHGQWMIGNGDAHVNASDGIKMIEQAYSFVRNNRADDDVQIVANDKFLMNKQMQELEGSRAGGGSGEVPSLFKNYDVLTCYSSNGILLDGARSVEEGLEVLAKELETNPNIFGSVSFNNSISLDIDEGIFSNHQYRIIGYNKDTGIVKLVNPHDSSTYMELPLEIFKVAEPSFSVFKINKPKEI